VIKQIRRKILVTYNDEIGDILPKLAVYYISVFEEVLASENERNTYKFITQIVFVGFIQD
jgi:hypothetical protein